MADLGAVYGPIYLAHGVDGQKVPVTLDDITNYRTLEAGVATPTLELSKDGGAYASPSDGTWTEVSDGDYTVTLNATDTNTLGGLILRAVKATVSAESRVYCIVATSPAEQRANYIRNRQL